jgi:hypothetical protein
MADPDKRQKAEQKAHGQGYIEPDESIFNNTSM